MGELSFALREVRGRLLRMNQAVGEKVGLGITEMEFVDLIARLGSTTPGAIASATGLSPPTVTGVLDRLEQDGWIRRERDPGDRRRVIVNAVYEKAPELGRRYAGMLTRLSAIYQDYSQEELELLLDFLHKVRDAGDESVSDLRASE